MRVCSVFLITALWLATVVPALAQFKEGGSTPQGAEGPKLGKSEVSRWRVGVVVRAVGGDCRGMYGYMAIPDDWPEQEVTIADEDVSTEARVHYEKLPGSGVKIMVVKIARLATGQEAKALVTFEVRRSELLPPKDTDAYVLPDPTKLPRDVRPYLVPSPQIECRDPKIRQLAKEIGADKTKAWDRVEAIYDWVREHIKDKDQGGVPKGAQAALKDGNGDCEARTSVFIAICRAADIPARTVWVFGHVYPEFYLCDDKGEGHWFPCQSRGGRQFGGITEMRAIFQKGDNVRPPRNASKEHQRLLRESLTGTPSPGGGKPQVRFVREAATK
jgi:hypothetical protein